ncbi:bifunctional 2-C-methyl-D-erythritol 4-phosphate cytidylyltransferase/2-C-methyl-D-erythritol 2,4-cyclodiphosphate synthase [Caminibacter mediatlanticus TB-2]|uniref:Bifunctional enzyme IspD/IspF n=1 Tax=Caminibacter mediatlanticus TB-2 TaxID=391592 RepID=A0ABX5VAK9_9BACT|nr:bifunctional 2-C-methyl-D-erythritol 4-phosphate cytidylyltransferase/2-C-methyl-D-erythritol 2,4-cyclodiphosphate synthase [Caminibacter mediatlanticus]QCT94437.1 bifunctional 2-C-methyl-D-erythritol 4-phosphate cytidylyltransferase/2-C-methyl-D-erythritol 2,4-cyclodiphosphate synthase [Caminibacter mediatlanticus TB-2]
MDISLIVLSAGNSTRFNYNVKKQWIRIENKPLWLFVADRLNNFYNFKKTIITANNEEVRLYEKLSEYEIVSGDKERQLSLKNALNEIDSEFVMVTDVARACVSEKIIKNLIENIKDYDCCVPFLKPVDTVVFEDKTINREKVKLIQTPQLSKTEILKKALNTDTLFTDERAAIENIGGKIKYIAGDEEAKKITYFKDLNLPCLKPPSKNIFSGIGYDTHKFEENKEMYLGGVKIDVNYGFKAHSDGDVLIHSLIDALLGAAGYGDIGDFFPDTDEKYKNISSVELLKKVLDIIKKTGFEIVNADVTIIAEKPKLKNYKTKIQRKLSKLLNAPVNIKATTNEKMGYIGREEGVSVISIVNLKYKDWYEDYNSRK